MNPVFIPKHIFRKYIYLLIFGCAGSVRPHALFAVHKLLIVAASPVAEHGL